MRRQRRPENGVAKRIFYFQFSLGPFQDDILVVFTSFSQRQRFMLVVKKYASKHHKIFFNFVVHALFNNSS